MHFTCLEVKAKHIFDGEIRIYLGPLLFSVYQPSSPELTAVFCPP